jgi:crotonobetainyl-CoA:carnitine CoA-transferase CaiB-like acyl-CoA transferase
MTRAGLKTYLRDHLAGAAAAIALLSGMIRRNSHRPGAVVLRALLDEVRADERTLRLLAESLGAKPPRSKQLLGAVAGRVSRARLNALSRANDAFAMFEGLEMLAIGMLGKRSLWRALSQLASRQPEIERLNLGQLETRALDQFAQVEALRVAMVDEALLPGR